jgi:Flp pilus assembly protein TadG
MKTKFSIFPQSKKQSRSRGQAMVEFAIALPVLLMLLFGIMEVSRVLLTYALVINASRDAVRYASAVGLNNSGTTKYNDCSGIISVAQKSAYFVPVSISASNITYDTQPGATPFASCGSTVTVASGNRVNVTVQATYTPIIKLLPIPSRTFTVVSSRTILGDFSLAQ